MWESNGTAAGTFMVLDINSGNTGSYPSYLTAVGGVVYFVANDGTHGPELWESNGTQVGTALVADINPGSNGSAPFFLTNVSGTLFFAANDGVHGTELWRTNGAAFGTSLVRDINPGILVSNPASDQCQRHALLCRQRRRARHGVVGKQRNDGGNVLGSGHHATVQRLRTRFPHERRRDALLRSQRRYPRTGAVEEQRHKRAGPNWSPTSPREPLARSLIS